jgi:hypothetical protein
VEFKNRTILRLRIGLREANSKVTFTVKLWHGPPHEGSADPDHPPNPAFFAKGVSGSVHEANVKLNRRVHHECDRDGAGKSREAVLPTASRMIA